MYENWIVNDGDENRENLEQSRYYDLIIRNWIVNDGDENRENLEQSHYYDLITRDGKFVPETVWYKKWFSFDDGSDNAAFVTYNDEAFSLSEVLAYCPVHKAGIAEAVMQILGLTADEEY